MKPAPPAVALARSDLHESLSDPALDAISFLNEVMDRFPRAVSFAPGAPFAGLLDGLDVADCLRRYQDYLAGERNMTPAQITKHLYQYGPSRGQINDLLAEALALDEGIAVTGGDIVVTVGCQEALLLVLRALCAGPGDLLAVVNPCFAGIAGAARLLDMPIHAVAETAQGVDLLQLEGICQAARERGQRVRALYVAPDFSNPSGTVLSLDARTRLLALAQQEDFLILEDNAYGFTAAEGSRLPTLKALDRAARVVYFGTCAKTCMPGVRVGFVVADQAVVDSAGKRGRLADELATLKSMVTVNTSPSANCRGCPGCHGTAPKAGSSYACTCR
jgi:(S)-3,5-dihydroxyphenylglycine transaminase